MYARFLLIQLILLVTSVCAVGATPGDLSLTDSPIRFAIIGDRTSDFKPGIYEEIVAEVENLKPDFVMTVGDAIEGYTRDTLTLNREWDEFLSIVKPLTMPIYFTPGNHDITYDIAQGPYENKIGKPFYSFNVRKYHFIVLDVTRWSSGEKLPPTELDWLISDLSSHRDAAQTLVFFHKPYWYNTTSMGLPDSLHSLFKTYGVDAVFNGHLHCYFSVKIDGILYTAVGSSGGIIDTLPSDLNYHFTWVTVTDTGISIAPIKIGAVKSWDIVSASEEHLVDKIIRTSLKFAVPAPVDDNLKVTSTTIRLEIENIAAEPLNDTIKWQTPPGWSIQPASSPLIIESGEKKEIEFQVNSTGDLYPLPAVTLRFPYAKSKAIPFTKRLRITRMATAENAATPPVIDGILDDKCWTSPVSQLFNEEGRPAAIESTQFYFAYDKDNLYLAAHCTESQMNLLRESVTSPDGPIAGDDCVGFYIQPDCKIDTAYLVYFNPLTTALDQKISFGSLGYFGGDKSWNGDYRAKTSKGDRYWNIEAQIPLAQIKALGVSGQSWGVNFLRKQNRLDDSAVWQTPVDYDPQTFGVLKFR
jgi:predicted phosphodiesterase